MRRLKKIGKGIGITAEVLLVIILLFNSVCYIKGKITGEQCPLIFGFGTAVVATGSMEPNVKCNDMVFIVKAKEYKVSEIATYQGETFCVTHRIVGIREDSFGNRIYELQGDANNIAENVPASSMIGKVVFRVPFVGLLRSMFLSPVGIVFLAVLFFTICVLPSLISEKKQDTAKTQEKVGADQ